MPPQARHLTRACIHLDRLDHNLQLLQELAGERPMWPAIKANGYGHGMELVASHLLKSGYDTICVAHVSEAVTLIDAGLHANYLLLSATLPEHSEAIVAYGCEPAVCTMEMVESLAIEAEKADRQISVHLMVDTGMGRIGVTPSEAQSFLAQYRAFPRLRVRGLMSHFPCADEKDKTLSHEQISAISGSGGASQILRNRDMPPGQQRRDSGFAGLAFRRGATGHRHVRTASFPGNRQSAG